MLNEHKQNRRGLGHAALLTLVVGSVVSGLVVIGGVTEPYGVIEGEGVPPVVVDVIRALLGFLQNLEESVEGMYGGGGCLLGKFASELAETHPRMRTELSRIFEDLVERLAPVFGPVAESSRKGTTPSGKDLAEMFLAVLEGSIILAAAHADPSRIVRGLRGFRDYLQRIVGERR